MTRIRGMQTVRDPKVLERMNLLFDLYETGEHMMRENLRRKFPDESPEQIEARLLEWLGRPSSRQREIPGLTLAPEGRFSK
ncbi:MAG TPA: hypothetical protein VF017_12845 [Thermoanaerobaculia bacterium]|nr:hypothetical protein [Thermoanaerobaculia bacterium]